MRRFIIAIFLSLILSACGQTTQEDCRADSAREAATTEALRVLLRECVRKYPAVQGPDGTFSLYVEDLDRSVEVSGATPTDEDREMIAALIEEKRTRDAEMLAELAQVNSQMRIIDLGITCRYVFCGSHNAHFSIENGSNSQIEQVAIWYEIGANVSCQGNYSKSVVRNITIPPGEIGSAEFNLPDNVGEEGRRHCIRMEVSQIL